MADRPLQNVIHHLRRTVAAEEAGAATDAQLLERFAARHDQEAFELLVWRHSRMVLGVCRRLLRDEHEAEDAFQAAFLILAKKAARISRGESVGGWLYRVAYRVALRARISAVQRTAREWPLDGLPVESSEADPCAEAAGRELRRAIDEEIDRLPRKHRAVFVLRCLAGKSNEEMARELGCPVGTIESRLTRAREKLRARLTRKGFVVSAGALLVGLSDEAAASVPEKWVNEVVKAAMLVVAGQAVAGAIPLTTIILMEGVLRAMLLSKAKTLTAVLLVLSLSALACVMLARGQANSEGEKAVEADKPKEAKRPAPAPPGDDDRIQPGDCLHVEAAPVFPDAPINGDFRVERQGTILLGIAYGRVQVKGQTLEEAEAAILRYLQENVVKGVDRVLVTRAALQEDERIRPGDNLNIDASCVLPAGSVKGVFRVEPRGTVALGLAYGRVQVKGQALGEAEATIRDYLERKISNGFQVKVTRSRAETGDLNLERRLQQLAEEVAALRKAVERLRK
jgi:RNA polymerase sigma factor (sigma-70 family)